MIVCCVRTTISQVYCVRLRKRTAVTETNLFFINPNHKEKKGVTVSLTEKRLDHDMRQRGISLVADAKNHHDIEDALADAHRVKERHRQKVAVENRRSMLLQKKHAGSFRREISAGLTSEGASGADGLGSIDSVEVTRILAAHPEESADAASESDDEDFHARHLAARAAAAAALSHVSETAKSDPAKKKKKKKLFSIAKTSRSGTGGVSAVLKRLQAAQRRWNGDSVDAGSNGPTMAGPTDAVRRPKAERVAAALHGEWCAAQRKPRLKLDPATGLEVDIVALSFDELPSTLRALNMAAATEACRCVEQCYVEGLPMDADFVERSAAKQHDIWRDHVRRTPGGVAAKRLADYAELSTWNKNKSRTIVRCAQSMYATYFSQLHAELIGSLEADADAPAISIAEFAAEIIRHGRFELRTGTIAHDAGVRAGETLDHETLAKLAKRMSTGTLIASNLSVGEMLTRKKNMRALGAAAVDPWAASASGGSSGSGAAPAGAVKAALDGAELSAAEKDRRHAIEHRGGSLARGVDGIPLDGSLFGSPSPLSPRGGSSPGNVKSRRHAMHHRKQSLVRAPHLGAFSVPAEAPVTTRSRHLRTKRLSMNSHMLREGQKLVQSQKAVEEAHDQHVSAMGRRLAERKAAMERVKQRFRDMDEDGSGTVSVAELAHALVGVKQSTVEALFAQFDKKKNGQLTLAEVAPLIKQIDEHMETYAETSSEYGGIVTLEDAAQVCLQKKIARVARSDAIKAEREPERERRRSAATLVAPEPSAAVAVDPHHAIELELQRKFDKRTAKLEAQHAAATEQNAAKHAAALKKERLGRAKELKKLKLARAKELEERAQAHARVEEEWQARLADAQATHAASLRNAQRRAAAAEKRHKSSAPSATDRIAEKKLAMKARRQAAIEKAKGAATGRAGRKEAAEGRKAARAAAERKYAKMAAAQADEHARALASAAEERCAADAAHAAEVSALAEHHAATATTLKACVDAERAAADDRAAELRAEHAAALTAMERHYASELTLAVEAANANATAAAAPSSSPHTDDNAAAFATPGVVREDAAAAAHLHIDRDGGITIDGEVVDARAALLAEMDALRAEHGVALAASEDRYAAELADATAAADAAAARAAAHGDALDAAREEHEARLQGALREHADGVAATTAREIVDALAEQQALHESKSAALQEKCALHARASDALRAEIAALAAQLNAATRAPSPEAPRAEALVVPSAGTPLRVASAGTPAGGPPRESPAAQPAAFRAPSAMPTLPSMWETLPPPPPPAPLDDATGMSDLDLAFVSVARQLAWRGRRPSAKRAGGAFPAPLPPRCIAVLPAPATAQFGSGGGSVSALRSTTTRAGDAVGRMHTSEELASMVSRAHLSMARAGRVLGARSTFLGHSVYTRSS